MTTGKMRVRGGDRLPWVDGEPIPTEMTWQARIFGAVPDELARWCQAHGLELAGRPFEPAHAAAGLKEGALYLLRPDTYVALADPAPTSAGLARYFTERGLALPSE
jgi:hypothetical protein